MDEPHPAAGRAEGDGGIHILRHTFCSRLAMVGAPAKASQELAGHQNLSTTQRYMHLSPAAKSAAIRMLEGPKRIRPADDVLRGIAELSGCGHPWTDAEES